MKYHLRFKNKPSLDYLGINEQLFYYREEFRIDGWWIDKNILDEYAGDFKFSDTQDLKFFNSLRDKSKALLHIKSSSTFTKLISNEVMRGNEFKFVEKMNEEKL